VKLLTLGRHGQHSTTLLNVSRLVTFRNMVERQRGELDLTFAALADPTRRTILTTLKDGERRVTDLARPLPLSLAAVSRHIAVLEQAGLVRRTVRGRDHFLSAAPERLAGAGQWMAAYTGFWEQRADALVEHLSRRKRSGGSGR
jgi:DNA-binding transcriptional ArsR family regulator